jgi:hypothetical protein
LRAAAVPRFVLAVAAQGGELENLLRTADARAVKRADADDEPA